MSSVTITPCTITDLENDPHMQALVDEYAQESAIDGLPHPSAKGDVYRSIETTGLLQPFAARIGDELIGFILVLAAVIPHYGVHIATTESFFVGKAHRATGAGLKLLRTAEAHALAKGSPGLLVSAPSEGILSDVLPQVGYAQTNRVFFKRFA